MQIGVHSGNSVVFFLVNILRAGRGFLVCEENLCVSNYDGEDIVDNHIEQKSADIYQSYSIPMTEPYYSSSLEFPSYIHRL